MMNMCVSDCEKEKNAITAAYSCLPYSLEHKNSKEGKGVSTRILRVAFALKKCIGNIAFIAAVICIAAFVLRKKEGLKRFMPGIVGLVVVCVSVVISAIILYNLLSYMQRALSFVFGIGGAANKERSATHYRRTSSEYERDVMKEVDRLTDVIIGDGADKEYTEAGYIKDVRKEADKIANAVIDEMQCGRTGLDDARCKERAISQYNKAVKEDAAKIVDFLMQKMNIQKECSPAVCRERRSAQYEDDVESEADRMVDVALSKARLIQDYYDCDDNNSANRGTTCTMRMMLKHLLEDVTVLPVCKKGESQQI